MKVNGIETFPVVRYDGGARRGPAPLVGSFEGIAWRFGATAGANTASRRSRTLMEHWKALGLIDGPWPAHSLDGD